MSQINSGETKITMEPAPIEEVVKVLRVINRAFGSEPPPEKTTTSKPRGKQFGLHSLKDAYKKAFGHE